MLALSLAQQNVELAAPEKSESGAELAPYTPASTISRAPQWRLTVRQ